MRDFIIKDLFEITGKLPLLENERYIEYSLKKLLSSLGYFVHSIFIDVDNVEYKHLKKKYRYMVANVYLRLNAEQKAKFATDQERVLCNIRARYAGDNDNWEKAAYTWVDDIVIRYGEDFTHSPYPITFSHFTLNGKRYQLYGARLDWSWFEEQEARAERKERQANNYWNHHYDYGLDDEYEERLKEQDELIYEAFEDNIDVWRCK